MALPNIKFRTYEGQSSLDSPGEVMVRIDNLSLPLTLDPPPKGLWAAGLTDPDLIDIDGNVLEDYPLVAGFNPIRISELTSFDGPTPSVWALW